VKTSHAVGMETATYVQGGMMSRKITVTYTVTYDLRKDDLAQEYMQYVDSYRDNKANRKWFAIDRFVGHNNLRLFDKKAKLQVTEEK
jgi:hypothetical protein